MADTSGDRVRRERDLYWRLLQLDQQRDLEPLLREALALVVEVTGASQGYLEVRDARERDGRLWSIEHGFSAEQVSHVRTLVSRGIIGEALATGRTVATASALLDPRFRERQSVITGEIEAVLCAPVGEGARLGVLYLQGQGAFSDEDRGDVEAFARHFSRIAEQLLDERRRFEETDATRDVRARLRAPALVGRCEAMVQLLTQVAAAAPLDVSVLLTGETGTGKSMLARIIHDNSARAGGPFVELNCAALPEGLVESELFGAFPGAHSTATRRIEGKVASAETGTLFLDEVGELTAGAQAKLLQLLQAHEYFPLGATKPLHANVRVIAATNTDLDAAVAERRFREDLYYRLYVLPLRVPSLAERRDDIVQLAAHFCEVVCDGHHFPRVALSPGALDALETAEWPGNVRQLAHAVEAAAIRATGERARWIERRHLFPDDDDDAEGAAAPVSLQEAVRRFQRRLIGDTLADSGWNVVEASRRLDVARSHFYGLMRALGITRPG